MALRAPFAAAVLLTAVSGGLVAAQTAPPACGATPITGDASLSPADAKTYQLVPFEVPTSTTRIDVAYDWADNSPLGSGPTTGTTVDLGVWDADGYRSADGFRGWSGSRHKQVHIAVDTAERNYRPGTIEAGTWWLEFGIGAVAPDGGSYTWEVTCTAPSVGAPPTPDPADPTHVADPAAGWFHGDFHMHGFHSNPNAPPYDEFVDFARQQGLDFFPLTEYVVDIHWDQLGPFQRANPDVLFWPGREIITYFGHVTQFGPTPGAIEYRHGFEDVTIANIVAGAKSAGALVGVAHPTTFKGTIFENFCRGCGWELESAIGWGEFDTIEVVTGPVVVRPDPRSPGSENPFVDQAVELWEDLLNVGTRLTAVGASDDKVSGAGSGPTYSPHGVPATAVYAQELSLPALRDAVRSGRAYVRTRGVAESPALEITVVDEDGALGGIGDTFTTPTAEVTVEVVGGGGQMLRVIRNGDVVDLRPIPSDAFTHTFTADRFAFNEGPLGTWWRFETFDAESRTTIANPFFLADAVPPTPTPTDPTPTPAPSATPAVDADAEGLPATGGGAAAIALALLLAGWLGVRVR